MRLNPAERIDVRGVGFDNVTLTDAASILSEHIENGGTLAAVYTPNSEIVDSCIRDESGELYRIINSAELVVPDGIGVVKASKILGPPLKEKVAGIELGSAMLAHAARHGVPVYFLGGKPGVAEAARDKLCRELPGLHVVGCADGYFEKTGAESDERICAIKSSGAVLLFVCLGAPTQEKWIFDNKSALADAGVRVAMGLGGSLDVYSGAAKRAPKLFISLGLEWLYRLLCEPRRIGRMMALPRFYFGVKRYSRQKKRQNTQNSKKSIQ